MMATNSPRATCSETPCSTSRGGRLMWNVLRSPSATTVPLPPCGVAGGGAVARSVNQEGLQDTLDAVGEQAAAVPDQGRLRSAELGRGNGRRRRHRGGHRRRRGEFGCDRGGRRRGRRRLRLSGGAAGGRGGRHRLWVGERRGRGGRGGDRLGRLPRGQS